MTEIEYNTSDLEVLADLENYYLWIFDEIRPFLGSRLADVGAGVGTFTKFLINEHLASNPSSRLEAFEPAGNLYKHLCEMLHNSYAGFTETGRLTAREGDFQTAPEQFDSVVMINVLEHIQDDQEFVRLVHRSLTPGGTFIVFVPALQQLYSPLDRAVGHYRRYEKARLEMILHRVGFDVVKSKYMDTVGALSWYILHVLVGTQFISPRLARLYDRWFVPPLRRIEDWFPPRVGKNILMVGRKSVTVQT